MKVTLRKHGGLAGAVYLNAPPTEVDSDDLAPPAADELARLVDVVRKINETAEDFERDWRRSDELHHLN